MTSDDLAALLSDLGVDIRRSDGKEITGRCPVHVRTTGKEDRSPSWSMNSSTGLWICFSCGAKGTLTTLVSELTGDGDASLAVHRAIINTGINPVPVVQRDVPVDWVAFGKFVRVPQRLLNTRNIDPDMAWRYGIRWDTDDRCWIIPIVTRHGMLKGWQAKKVGWVRNFPVGVKKSETLFGIDRFTSSTAVLVESPLDVVRFASVCDPPQALASFGASVSDTQIRLLSESADRLIVALDNDEAGIAASKKLFKTLPNFKKGIRWFNYGSTNCKDIGDMTDDQIWSGVKNSTIIPPWIKENK